MLVHYKPEQDGHQMPNSKMPFQHQVHYSIPPQLAKTLQELTISLEAWPTNYLKENPFVARRSFSTTFRASILTHLYQRKIDSMTSIPTSCMSKESLIYSLYPAILSSKLYNRSIALARSAKTRRSPTEEVARISLKALIKFSNFTLTEALRSKHYMPMENSAKLRIESTPMLNAVQQMSTSTGWRDELEWSKKGPDVIGYPSHIKRHLNLWLTRISSTSTSGSMHMCIKMVSLSSTVQQPSCKAKDRSTLPHYALPSEHTARSTAALITPTKRGESRASPYGHVTGRVVTTSSTWKRAEKYTVTIGPSLPYHNVLLIEFMNSQTAKMRQHSMKKDAQSLRQTWAYHSLLKTMMMTMMMKATTLHWNPPKMRQSTRKIARTMTAAATTMIPTAMEMIATTSMIATTHQATIVMMMMMTSMTTKNPCLAIPSMTKLPKMMLERTSTTSN